MARSFVESVEFFLTSPRLNTDGLLSFTELEITICTRENCENKNYLTDIICRNCLRSPKPVDRFYWILITFFIIAFHSIYYFQQQLGDLQQDLLKILFIGFLICFSYQVSSNIFKFSSPYVNVTVWGFVVLIVFIALMPYLGLEGWIIFLPYLLGLGFFIAIIASLINSSYKFCKQNDISPLIPFFIVLPLDFLLISLLLKVFSISKYIDEVWVLLDSWLEQYEFGAYIKIVINWVEISTNLRLGLLILFLLILFLGPGVMATIKSRFSGQLSTTKFSVEIMRMIARNTVNSFRPIVTTWAYINLQAFSGGLITPFIYVFILFLWAGLFLYIPVAQEAMPAVAFVLILILAFIIPLFVTLAGGYKYNLYFQVLNNFIKAYIKILAWIIPCIIIVDLSFNAFVLDASKIVGIIFAIIMGIIFLFEFANDGVFSKRKN